MHRAIVVSFLAAVGVAVGASRAAGQDSSAKPADPGKAVFEGYCTPCHGAEGKGDGAAGAGLQPPPANFTDSEWKYGGDLASVKTAIENGATGTAMPPWKSILKAEEIEAVAKYVIALSPAAPQGAKPPAAAPAKPPAAAPAKPPAAAPAKPPAPR
jgi:cbb3-type cytochrome c oxidase subunit III